MPPHLAALRAGRQDLLRPERVYQASAPSRANSSTHRAEHLRSLQDSLQPSQKKTAMGTPHTRWREMHQSGRVAIMLEMRSSPQAGSHLTFLISSSARLSAACRRRSLAFHGDEPLLGGAEDHRIVAAPAVRIGVLDLLLCSSTPRLFSSSMIGGLASKTCLAVVFRQAIAQTARLVHVAGLGQLVFRPGVEVVGAVRRRGVHRAGALVHGDVIRQHAQDLRDRGKGCAEGGVLQLAAREAALPSRRHRIRSFSAVTSASFSATIYISAARLQRHVFLVRMKRHRHRSRQRPWSRGPDDGRNLFPSSAGIDLRRITRKTDTSPRYWG